MTLILWIYADKETGILAGEIFLGNLNAKPQRLSQSAHKIIYKKPPRDNDSVEIKYL